MGAVQFLSATAGVGITAERFPCFGPIKGGGEREVGFQAQPVRLAVTSDGGRSWRLTGTSVPVRRGWIVEQIAAASAADVWVIGAGRLVATYDRGAEWHVQNVPTPVVRIAIEDGFVWAVSCPHGSSADWPGTCQLELWRIRPGNGFWTRVPLPRVRSIYSGYVQFAVASTHLVLALPAARHDAPAELLRSEDAGLRWTMRPAPTWDKNTCGLLGALALTAQSPRTFWLLCLGGAAAGSSTKGLLRSTNGGVTWNTVSAAASLIERPAPGAIPLEEPSALAAGSQKRLWLSLTNGLAESDDGGRRWVNVPQAFDPAGYGTVIDAFDSDHAWVLASGAGLWRTTDGLNWRPDGPLNTG